MYIQHNLYHTDHMKICKQHKMLVVQGRFQLASITLMSSMIFLLLSTGHKSLQIFLLNSLRSSQLIVQIYKLLHIALGTKARAVKVKHDLLHNILQVNQSKTSGTNLSHKNSRENDGSWTV